MPTDLTSKSRNHRQPEAFPHIPASWRLCAEYKLLIFSFQQWLETWPAPEKLELLFFFCCSTIVESVLKKSTTLLFVTDFIIVELYPFNFAISKKHQKCGKKSKYIFFTSDYSVHIIWYVVPFFKTLMVVEEKANAAVVSKITTAIP